jgi:hypothetical protein
MRRLKTTFALISMCQSSGCQPECTAIPVKILHVATGRHFVGLTPIGDGLREA